MNTKDLHPALGSGALREALTVIRDHLVMVDENWYPNNEELRGRIQNMIAEADAALSLSSPIEPALREITIQEFAAGLYQICGALNAPAPVLDQLSAAASGKPLPYTTLLPFPTSQASSEIREAQAWLASMTPRPEIIAVSSTVWGVKWKDQMICAPTIVEAVAVLQAAEERVYFSARESR